MVDLIRTQKNLLFFWTPTGECSEIDVYMCGIVVIIVNIYVLLYNNYDIIIIIIIKYIFLL